ncbi:RagB/SusD family nutrient uptake outer membrane protein [Spongiivirga citrea]|uniref:RagB/SusD family nutrient uptake outer membrane protein n=1 Tax=Spongiivirga citrea TaxID=1481457 RepID=A0A6M0CP38_9FLAO|nr:RagB/SusD family nutrient uptake outer membrane protein [Spongiivirga citrea]NER17824.1 RagB/SusD family nutrient uptake outer membrane protein [Spongiivirga citrea]
MKIFKYIILVTAFLMFSCNDEFLERIPLDEVSNETFWNNENDIINYNNNLYELVKDDRRIPILMGLGVGPGVNFRDGLWWMDEMSDNLGATHPRAVDLITVSTGNFNVQNSARAFGYDPKGWELVRAINFGLENYDRVAIDEDVLNQYKGEARLFRGWFYAEKVSKFGDMQWIDKVLATDSPELNGARDDRDFVMGKALEDLDYAIANLPAEWGPPNDGQDPGRVDKWVALAVKSRVCLFEGTWRKYHGLSGADTWLQESVDASTELMNTGGFSLYTTGNPMGDYRYASSSTTQAGNPEVIYWRKYEALTNGHFASRLFWNYNGGATKSFVDDFLCDDGLPISLSTNYAGDAQIEDVFVNRDLRLRQCVLAPEDQELLNYANDPANTYPRLNGMAGGRNRSNTGYHVVKHWNAVDELSPRNQHTVSPPCLRLGEVYLNFAEAKAELGTINQGDLDISINLLRDRVGMPGLDINPPMDPAHADDGVSALIVEIRRERRVELFLEGHRYNDLRRWKQGRYLAAPTLGMRFDAAAEARYPGANIQTMSVDGVPYIDVRTGTPFEPKFEDKMYLWPLPTSSLSQNPNLGQNPGW